MRKTSFVYCLVSKKKKNNRTPIEIIAVTFRRYCRRLEEAYTMMIFMQYFASTVAVCVSCFVVVSSNIKTTINCFLIEFVVRFQTFIPEQMVTMLMFFLGHIVQFFNYCSIGNELIREVQNCFYFWNIFSQLFFELFSLEHERLRCGFRFGMVFKYG